MAIPPLQDSILATTTTFYRLGLVGLLGSNSPYCVFPMSRLVNAWEPIGDFGGSFGKASRKKAAVLLDFVQRRGGRALPKFFGTFFKGAFLANKRCLFSPK